MRPDKIALLLAGAALAISAPLTAGSLIPNWPVPGATGRSALVDLSSPIPFIAVTPCRLVDTRGNGAPLTGGFLAAGASRSYTLAGAGTCGIPASASAISLNITVTNTAGPGFVQAYPQGGSAGGVSSINYVAGQSIANAAIVPMAGGAITLTAGVSGTDIVLDTNGYFGSVPAAGNGFDLFSSTGGYGLHIKNSSPSCFGACGVFSEIDSSQASVIAIFGQATGTSANNYGVLGLASGSGPTAVALPNASVYSAGLYGKASNLTTGVAGVIGETLSSHGTSTGVLGLTAASPSSAGLFYNSGSGVSVFVASSTQGIGTNGSISGVGLSISGSKMFIAPHPEDPSKEIKYISVEARTSDVYFRGTGHLIDGVARIEVPDDFRLTAREDSYMTTATSVGSRAFAVAVESEGPDGIVFRGLSSGTFHYVVYAERDVMRDHQAVQPNVDFTPAMIARTDATRFMPERMKAILVKNGTMNPDGGFNEATARRLGWVIPETTAPVPASPSIAIKK